MTRRVRVGKTVRKVSPPASSAAIGSTPGIPSAIDDLSDVDTTTGVPSTDDRLRFDGSNWVPIGPLLVPDSGSPKVPMTNEDEDEWIYGD